MASFPTWLSCIMQPMVFCVFGPETQRLCCHRLSCQDTKAQRAVFGSTALPEDPNKDPKSGSCQRSMLEMALN